MKLGKTVGMFALTVAAMASSAAMADFDGGKAAFEHRDYETALKEWLEKHPKPQAAE